MTQMLDVTIQTSRFPSEARLVVDTGRRLGLPLGLLAFPNMAFPRGCLGLSHSMDRAPRANMSRNRMLEAASLIQGSETDPAIIPSYSIKQAITEPRERARPTPSIKSVKKFGEHDLELAHILRLRLNSPPCAVWMHKDLHTYRAAELFF